MLAIAARTFSAPTETFIHDHVRMIAPDETILLCEDERGAEQFGRPFLEINSRQKPRSFGRLLINVARRGWQRVVDPGLWPRDRRRAFEFLSMHGAEAVLAEYGPTGCLLARVCREADIPLFVHFHGFDANVLPEKLFVRQQYKRLFADAHGVIVTSEFLKTRLLHLQCPNSKLAVCPCGVNTVMFRPGTEPKTSKMILMVGRLTPQKGPLESIRSFARSLQSHPDAVLEIIGDGPLRMDAEAVAKKLGLDGHVYFHGARPHEFVRSRLQVARMLIQHCVSTPRGGVESLGLSLLEAMACELPVVSTRHGALMETVQEGITGLLVDEHDIASMADAMTELLDNPERATAMGVAGRQRVLAYYAQDKACDRLRAIMNLQTRRELRVKSATATL